MWPFSSNTNTKAQLEDAPSTLSAEVLAEARQSYIDRHQKLNPERQLPTAEPTSLFTAEPDPLFSDQENQRVHRLGIPPSLRAGIIGTVAFVSGFTLGTAHGSNTARLRYRAENAHHVPTSKAGWYLYHKSANYHSIIGGAKEGMKNGTRLGGWALIFLAIEEGLDRARGRVFARQDEEERLGQRDFLNTVSAAVALSGIYSKWSHVDRFAGMRMTRSAIKYALPLGLAQDLIATLKGDRPWYVEWALKSPVPGKDQQLSASL